MTIDDLIKCPFCRRGVYPFTKSEERFLHLDIFATPEAGESYECINQELISSILEERAPNTNVYLIKDKKFKEEYINSGEEWNNIRDILLTMFNNDIDLANIYFDENDLQNKTLKQIKKFINNKKQKS